mmetsp:Transcript_89891/g.196725  ORF Transcript_89891/g.196725 Transcript_89891/m.196725 type:complete len:225 (-) Transcript_89891:7-681(-)
MARFKGMLALLAATALPLAAHASAPGMLGDLTAMPPATLPSQPSQLEQDQQQQSQGLGSGIESPLGSTLTSSSGAVIADSNFKNDPSAFPALPTAAAEGENNKKDGDDGKLEASTGNLRGSATSNTHTVEDPFLFFAKGEDTKLPKDSWLNRFGGVTTFAMLVALGPGFLLLVYNYILYRIRSRKEEVWVNTPWGMELVRRDLLFHKQESESGNDDEEDSDAFP